MEMKKAMWTNDDDTFSLSMSISKVDKKNRLVYGWATLDNPDLQDDVVTFEASQKAFAKFRGNLREMHQKIAAGRVVSYRPEQYVDEDGEIYNGLYVAAYVSEGAEDTWKKVLDGTLAAFSINGTVNDYYTKYSEKLKKTLRYVTDYTMAELSLVDSGGNQLTNVVSFVKDVDGVLTMTGDLANVEVQNVFLCKEDRLVELSQENVLSCHNGHDMNSIGWVETKTAHTMEKVNSMVKEYLGLEKEKSDEGGVDVMADEAVTENKEVVEEAPAVEESTSQEAVVVDETAGAEAVSTDKDAEQADQETEVASEEETAVQGLEKAIGEAIEAFKQSDERREERVSQIMKDIDGKFVDFTKEVNERLTAYEEKQDEIQKALDSVSGSLENMSKDVDGLQTHSAVKKSGDLGGSPEGDLTKSDEVRPGIWRGSIL